MRQIQIKAEKGKFPPCALERGDFFLPLFLSHIQLSVAPYVEEAVQKFSFPGEHLSPKS